MRINVKAKGGSVPEALRQHVEKKVAKLERYFRAVDSVIVEQSTERGMQILEVSVTGDGIILRSEERCGDPYVAVDSAVDKMERQVQRFKTRIRRSHQRPGAVKEATAAALTGLVELPETESAEGEEAYQPRIARRKRFPMKPMSAEEAAQQMELLGHSFFLFMNEESGRVNVLYRRRDGDYGLIEPED